MKTNLLLFVCIGLLTTSAFAKIKTVSLNCTNGPVAVGQIEYVINFKGQVKSTQSWCSSGEGQLTVTSNYVGETFIGAKAVGKMQFSSCNKKGLTFGGVAVADSFLVTDNIFRVSLDYTRNSQQDNLLLHAGNGIDAATEFKLTCTGTNPKDL